MTVSTVKLVYKSIIMALGDLESVYYFLYCLCAILAIWKTHFVLFLLGDIIYRNEPMLNTVKALWRARNEVAATFLLYNIGVYIFALFGYKFFHKDFDGFCD